MTEDPARRQLRTSRTFSKHANQAATAPAYFSVWDMHAYYGESYIVQGVSFNVHEGEILALLGRNGAGKTSTLRAIARLDNPRLTHGEIWLDHKPLHKMKAYRGRAGRHLAGARRPAHHPRPDGRGKPRTGADRSAHRLVARADLRTVPAPRRTPQAGRRDAVGRRAADARHRPRAWPATSRCCCSTNPTRASPRSSSTRSRRR